MNKINICYTFFEKELSSNLFNEYLVPLPEDQRKRNAQYHRWQDRQAHLFGRLLLREGWMHAGKENLLNRVQYDSMMRPFIPGNIDFNISHSGNYVLCAIGEGVKLGIDIELCDTIAFNDYQSFMNERQWVDIYGSRNPYRTFFRYWAMKEAVIKADGRGLSMPLESIVFEYQEGIIQTGHWFLQELKIDTAYQTWLACNTTDVKIVLKKFIF